MGEELGAVADAMIGLAEAFRKTSIGENGLTFGDHVTLTAADLLNSISDELSLHMPELGEDRIEFLAGQMVQRVFRDMKP